MSNLHPLLLRQMKKVGFDFDEKKEGPIRDLLERVSKGYYESDNERYIAERSFEISSQEMWDLRKKLLKESQYLQSIVSEGFCTVNSMWKIKSINQEAERILGVDAGTVIDKTIHSFLDIYKSGELRTPLPMEMILDDVSQGHIYSGARCYVKNTKGKFIPVFYSINPLPLAEDKFSGAIFVFRDITDTLRFEESLQKAVEKANQSSQAKSMFLANMSHEIRTPMNGVLGTLQLLKHTQIDERQSEYIELALSSGSNLLRIIDDILDFSKLDADQIQIEPTDFNLHQEMVSFSTLFKVNADKKKIKIKTHIEKDVPIYIRTDPYRLRQILLNLLSNAIKFTPHEGSITIEVALFNSDSNTLLFSVSDTGIGIDSKALEGIFNPFQQADQSTTRRYGGTGLGLAICRKLAEKLNGEIWVNSEVGKGSTFSFTIEFEAADAPVTQEENNSIVVKTTSVTSSIDALVVDDNPINLKVVSAMLQLLNCKVETATNGKEALKKLQDRHYDIVFMDCHMPVMDGCEATKQFRIAEESKGIKAGSKDYTKIIALTADAFQSTHDRCMSLGMDGFISKPFKLEQLKDVIQQNTSHD